jgi:hypothetical protein
LERTILPKLTTVLNIVTTWPLHIYLASDDKQLQARFDCVIQEEDTVNIGALLPPVISVQEDLTTFKVKVYLTADRRPCVSSYGFREREHVRTTLYAV